jgi:hypothetical protein
MAITRNDEGLKYNRSERVSERERGREREREREIG